MSRGGKNQLVSPGHSSILSPVCVPISHNGMHDTLPKWELKSTLGMAVEIGILRGFSGSKSKVQG